MKIGDLVKPIKLTYDKRLKDWYGIIVDVDQDLEYHPLWVFVFWGSGISTWHDEDEVELITIGE